MVPAGGVTFDDESGPVVVRDLCELTLYKPASWWC